MNGPAPYNDHLTEIGRELAERGSQGVMVLDASSMGAIETAYGSDAYEEVRQRLFTIFGEQQGKDFRTGDISRSTSRAASASSCFWNASAGASR